MRKNKSKQRGQVSLGARRSPEPRFTLLGVGAMNSRCYQPAGLLVEYSGWRVMLDGGPGAIARGNLNAWLITDEHAELIRELRTLAKTRNVEVSVGA